MTVLDCLLQNLPLILIGIGLVLLAFIIAAVVVVLNAAAPPVGGFADAVLAVLASWWIPIALSVLGSLMLAYQLCNEQVNNVPVQANNPPQLLAPIITLGVAMALTALVVTQRPSKKVNITSFSADRPPRGRAA